MNLQDVCENVFAIALSVCKGVEAPIAYVNLEVGKDFPFSDEDLYKCYHKIVWDTDLSSSDLNIEKTGALRKNEISVVSFSEFSDGDSPERIHIVPLNAYRFSV